MNKKIALTVIIIILIAQNCDNAAKYADLGWQEIEKIRLTGKNDASLALNYFDQALAIDSKNHKALHGLGVVLSGNPKTRKIGIKNIKRAIKINGKYPEAYKDLAEIVKLDGNSNKAMEILKEGLQQNPKSVKLYIARAVFLSERKLLYEAENNFRTAEKLNPLNPYIYYYRALNLIKQNDTEEAELQFKKAYELEHNNPDFLSGFARILVQKNNQIKKQINDLKILMKNTKDDSTESGYLTKITNMQEKILKNEELARDLVGQALSINPRHASSLHLRHEVLDKDSVEELIGPVKKND
jgi:tetratricopeptide (TPR) repeat protein